MNYKLLAISIFTLVFLYRLFLLLIEYRSSGNALPENVRDVYNEEEFARWQAYNKERVRNAAWCAAVGFAAELVLLITDAYTHFASLFGDRPGMGAFSVILLMQIVDSLCELPFRYVATMRIEQKYGFNRSTKKTFFVDQIKGFLIPLMLIFVLTSLFAVIFEALGAWTLLLFYGVMIASVLTGNFLYPVFSKLNNKFTPLEDGELKDKLTALLEKHGYHVRAIRVMDASRRTTKPDAYFSGFGKTKTITLFDNLVTSQTPDQICAVFAHEMGHGIHKDTLKNSILSFINIAVLVLLAFATASTPAIFTDFGFSGVNYGFCVFLLFNVEFSLISPLFGLLQNALSRRAEYRADKQAVEDGYGEAIVGALKQVCKDNFVNLAPSPLLVKLEYSHPTLSQRIAAIEAELAK